MKNVLADKFIGQSGKASEKGMTQKQQLAQLEQFREEERLMSLLPLQ